MDKIEYLEQRLAIGENLIVQVIEVLQRQYGTADVGLWNELNVAKGKALIQYQSLQLYYEKAQNGRIVTDGK